MYPLRILYNNEIWQKMCVDDLCINPRSFGIEPKSVQQNIEIFLLAIETK